MVKDGDNSLGAVVTNGNVTTHEKADVTRNDGVIKNDDDATRNDNDATDNDNGATGSDSHPGAVVTEGEVSEFVILLSGIEDQAKQLTACVDKLHDELKADCPQDNEQREKVSYIAYQYQPLVCVWGYCWRGPKNMHTSLIEQLNYVVIDHPRRFA